MSVNKPYKQRITHRPQCCSLWFRMVVASLLILLSSSTAIADETILLVHDGKNELTQDIIFSLSQYLTTKSIPIDLLDVSDQALPDNLVLKNYTTLLTLGPQAAEITLERNPPAPVLSLLVTGQSWQLLKQAKSLYPRSAILLDQPVSRQIQLIRAIENDETQIGVLLGPYSSQLETQLTDTSKQLQQSVTIKTIQNADELIPALNGLIEQVNYLLAEPDSVVYNKRTIQGILLLTYRNKTPVIGFSQAYSRAGAMVSLYSDADDITRQAAEIIFDKPATDRTYSPKYFSITYNQQVARTLGYNLPDEKELIKTITLKEKSH